MHSLFMKIQFIQLTYYVSIISNHTQARSTHARTYARTHDPGKNSGGCVSTAGDGFGWLLGANHIFLQRMRTLQSHPVTSRTPSKMGLKDAVVVASDPQEEEEVLNSVTFKQLMIMCIAAYSENGIFAVLVKRISAQ